MRAAQKPGRVPILTGGTGLYFAALTRPRRRARPRARELAPRPAALLAEQGPEALHAGLAKVDPATAARFKPNDSQRIARAWEVWRGTGMGLAAWQPARCRPRRGGSSPSGSIRRGSSFAPPSPRGSPRCSSGRDRGGAGAAGAGLDPALPAMRAHGVPELSGYLRGTLSLEAAGRRTELVTGQYTKRQATWFRHHDLASPEEAEIINHDLPINAIIGKID